MNVTTASTGVTVPSQYQHYWTSASTAASVWKPFGVVDNWVDASTAGHKRTVQR